MSAAQLIRVEFAVAVLIHHVEEDAEHLVEGLLGILRHFDAFRLLGIGRWHQHEHGGRAVVLPISPSSIGPPSIWAKAAATMPKTRQVASDRLRLNRIMRPSLKG